MQKLKLRGSKFYVFRVDGDVREMREVASIDETRQQQVLKLAKILHDLKTPLNCVNGTCDIFKMIAEDSMLEANSRDIFKLQL